MEQNAVKIVVHYKLFATFTSKNLSYNGKVFVFYSAIGVITTLIFWGTEYAYHLIYDTDLMRYLGGIVGLAVGFYVKYQLDKKHVFVNRFSEFQ